MLEVKNVTVRYGEKTVLDRACFSLFSGQWLMLCGPNGAGKSTLVNAIAQGACYEGDILLNGKNARSVSPRALARQIGVLAQTNFTGYDFTVGEIAALGRYPHTRGFLSGFDAAGDALVRDALEKTGMTLLKDHSMLTLSGGETQRAFLAQVFAQDPSLMILDEPANHLDLPYQQQLFSMIGEWLKTPGRAVISVVHDLSLAKKYGTHALLLSAGKITAQGKTDDVLSRENLERVYGMDVYAWMRDMLSRWKE